MLKIFTQDSSTVNSKNSSKIWDEQVKLVAKNAAISNVVSLVLALLLASVLWEEMPFLVMIGWLAYMTLIAALRIITAYLEKSKNISDHLHDLCGRWYLISILFAAAGWGVAAYLLFPENHVDQLIMAFVLSGMAAGGVPVLSPIIKIYYAYVALILIPLSVRLYQLGPEYHLLIILVLAFMFIMAVAGRRVNKAMISTLELRFHNESLVKFLSHARNESEDVNEELAEEIESRKRIEKELKAAKEIAETASKTKSEFLANMSHEIRTPMNGVLGTLQLLKDSELSESQREYVSIAYNSGESLLAILNDILDFSKIEAGKMTLESIPFSLEQTINELIILLKSKAEERNVKLVSEIDNKVAKVIKGDSVRIRQILTNLMTNAIKFTENGEVKIKLTVLDINDASIRVKLEVIDTGIGIPEEAQRKLFNSFTQADGSTTRKYGGTGLGLAIVRQLVTMMHGRLGVESKPDEGSCFWVELAFEILEQETIENEVEQKQDSDIVLKGRILLVEDNPVNQVVAKKMLEKIGLEYELANNGKEALEYLATDKEFKLVLMDCQMPVMDGYEATTEIRNQEKNSTSTHLTVIAMTANAMEGDKEQCLTAGMDDYIAKPVKLADLRAVLGKWLNHS